MLSIDEDFLSLAQSLMAGIPLAETSAVDAVRIAVAAANEIDYLVT